MGLIDHPEGAGSERGDRVDFDRWVRLEFLSAQISSDGGLLVMRVRRVADQPEADQDRVVRHASALTVQLAEVAVTDTIVRAILAAIRFVRAPLLSA
jgi:hypothetical protein